MDDDSIDEAARLDGDHDPRRDRIPPLVHFEDDPPAQRNTFNAFGIVSDSPFYLPNQAPLSPMAPLTTLRIESRSATPQLSDIRTPLAMVDTVLAADDTRATVAIVGNIYRHANYSKSAKQSEIWFVCRRISGIGAPMPYKIKALTTTQSTSRAVSPHDGAVASRTKSPSKPVIDWDQLTDKHFHTFQATSAVESKQRLSASTHGVETPFSPLFIAILDEGGIVWRIPLPHAQRVCKSMTYLDTLVLIIEAAIEMFNIDQHGFPLIPKVLYDSERAKREEALDERLVHIYQPSNRTMFVLVQLCSNYMKSKLVNAESISAFETRYKEMEQEFARVTVDERGDIDPEEQERLIDLSFWDDWFGQHKNPVNIMTEMLFMLVPRAQNMIREWIANYRQQQDELVARSNEKTRSVFRDTNGTKRSKRRSAPTKRNRSKAQRPISADSESPQTDASSSSSDDEESSSSSSSSSEEEEPKHKSKKTKKNKKARIESSSEDDQEEKQQATPTKKKHKKRSPSPKDSIKDSKEPTQKKSTSRSKPSRANKLHAAAHKQANETRKRLQPDSPEACAADRDADKDERAQNMKNLSLKRLEEQSSLINPLHRSSK